ncbi:MAG: hypothetical protein R3D57_06305 [Hyphomicrobiaceae bacterium]
MSALTRGGWLAGLPGLVVATMLSASPAMADGPFAGYAGRWVGNGSVTYDDGKTEAIKCRVTYFVVDGGSGLQQNIRCASASYKFEVRSDIDYAGGKVSGSWIEMVNNASGNVSGTASDNLIRASVKSDKLDATMSVKLSGASQSVNIAPKGLGVKTVSISLRKG